MTSLGETMKTTNGLRTKYLELQEIHYKILHELADAARIIKSYEYLEKKYKKENALLENVMSNADKLRHAKDPDSFQRQKNDLERAIQAYKASKENFHY